MSRSMKVAVLVCALGLVNAHSAAAQGSPPRYEDTCPAKWTDEIQHDTLVVKCRRAFRKNFLKGLAAPPLPSGLREFTVDPIALTADEHRHWIARQGVRIHVVNVNPYLYQYKVSVKQTPIVETAPFDFFKALLPGIAISPQPGSGQPRVPPLAAPDCRDLSMRVLWTEAESLSSGASIVELNIASLDSLDHARKKGEAVISSPKSKSKRVEGAALRTISVLRDYSDGMEPTVASIAELHQALTTHLQKSIPTDCGQVADELTKLRTALQAKDVAYRIAGGKLGSQPERFKLRDTIIKNEIRSLGAPLLDGGNFYAITTIGRERSEVDSVTIQRRPPPLKKDDPNPPYATTMVVATRIGLPRLFTIGGGLSYTGTPYRTYAAVKHYTGASAPADTVVNIVAEAASDSRRVTPMLTLGATIIPIDYFWPNNLVSGIGTQIGVTVSKDATTAVEYFLGGSLNLWDNRVYVAYGGYGGKEQALADGLVVGERLPGAQATVPVVVHTRWRRSWLFGFRFY